MITDAIRDEKVLKFKVDYNDVRPQFVRTTEQDDIKIDGSGKPAPAATLNVSGRCRSTF